VQNPEDSAYQVARRISDACLQDYKSPVKSLVKEGLSMGFYKMIDELISTIGKK
jgi:hypothetical protein